MITDSILIEKSLKKLVNYNWEEEMKHFMETYDIHIQSQDNLEEWIKICEEKNYINHIFYNLMILKSAYPDLFE